MKLFKNKPFSDWAEIRKIGKWKYAVTNGIIFGVMVFIFNLALMFFHDSYKAAFNVGDLIIFLFISLSIGIFGYSTLMWWIQEKLYQNKKKKNY